MAYPAFFVAPFVYRCNWHSQDTRSHSQPNSQKIVADTDAHATAYTTTLAAYLAGQLTSLTKRLGVHNPNVTHPTGSRLTANVLVLNSVGGSQRYHLRNLNSTLTDPIKALDALFLGTADVGSGVVALSAAPSLPDGGSAVTTVNTLIVTKH